MCCVGQDGGTRGWRVVLRWAVLLCWGRDEGVRDIMINDYHKYLHEDCDDDHILCQGVRISEMLHRFGGHKGILCSSITHGSSIFFFAEWVPGVRDGHWLCEDPEEGL